MSLNRRNFVLAGGLSAFAASALAQTPRSAQAPGRQGDPFGSVIPPDEIIPLWPGKIPGGEAVSPPAEPLVWTTSSRTRNVTVPMLGLYRPPNPDGSAFIVCPGGGYVMEAMAHEGSAVAKRFNRDRMTVFVLNYRLPGEGWTSRANVPLQDAQRAIRIVRSRAAEFSVDPTRVGVLGFSAGGHLAASLATCHAEHVYDPVDAADTQPAKPTFAALIYPVITFHDPFAHAGSRQSLVGPDASQALIDSRSIELRVTSDTSPCFLAQGIDDTTVPVENSLMMLSALRRHKVLCEAHLFEHGRHGFGLAVPGQTNEHWPEMFVNWVTMNARGA